MPIRLDSKTAKQIKKLEASDTVDLTEMAIQIGEDPKTFFQNKDWSGLELRTSKLTGVSFEGADLTGAKVTADQADEIQKTNTSAIQTLQILPPLDLFADPWDTLPEQNFLSDPDVDWTEVLGILSQLQNPDSSNIAAVAQWSADKQDLFGTDLVLQQLIKCTNGSHAALAAAFSWSAQSINAGGFDVSQDNMCRQLFFWSQGNPRVIQEALELTNTAVHSEIFKVLIVNRFHMYHQELAGNTTIIPRLNFRNVDISGAKLRNVQLSGADLNNANIGDLVDCDLLHTCLVNARCARSNLVGSNFSYADFRHADLSDTNLKATILNYAILAGADLSRANLQGAHLQGARLARKTSAQASIDLDPPEDQGLPSATHFKYLWLRINDESQEIERKLQQTSLVDADLRQANLSFADLSGADLSGARLHDANLNGAKLDDTNLRQADLSNAYINQNQLNSATGNRYTVLPSMLERPVHWPQYD